MKKIFCTALLLSACLLPTVAIPTACAELYPVYQETGDQWVGSLIETPRYASLADARKGKVEEQGTLVWEGFILRDKDDQWLHLIDEEGQEFWAEAAAFANMDTYLKNPPANALVKCEGEQPKPLRVDLDAKHKQIWLVQQTHPTLNGGARIIEIWDGDQDSGKKSLLWHSAPLDKIGWDNLLFCSPVGNQEIQLVADLNGDGQAELVIKGAQSEMGPGTFILLRWDGKAFVPLLERKHFISIGIDTPKSLPMIAVEDGPGDLFDGQKHLWVDDFLTITSDGAVVASLTILTKDAQGDGKARLRPDKNWNLVFEKWEEGPEMHPF